MFFRVPACLLTALLLCIAAPNAGAAEAGADSTQSAGPAPIWRPALYGALGGAAGFFAGAMLGAAHQDDTGDDISGSVYGGLSGQAIGVAFGSWIGNNRRGYWPLDLLLSGAILVAGVWASDQSDPTPFEVSLFLVGQLGATVAIEKFGESRRY